LSWGGFRGGTVIIDVGTGDERAESRIDDLLALGIALRETKGIVIGNVLLLGTCM
jgi:hypothetical protein